MYDFSNEEAPALLEDETATTTEMHFNDGQKLLVESESADMHALAGTGSLVPRPRGRPGNEATGIG